MIAIRSERKRPWRLDFAADVDKAKGISAHEEFHHPDGLKLSSQASEETKAGKTPIALGLWTLATEAGSNRLANHHFSV